MEEKDYFVHESSYVDEDVEIGEREDFVRPGGMESNWDDGNKEEIVIGD